MIIIATIAACATCGAIGYFVGWITTADRLDRRAEDLPGPGDPPAATGERGIARGPGPGRHAQTMPLRLKHLAPTEGELAGYYAAAARHVPALAAQPPLAGLVRPPRTTDFIERMRADTDTWLAARGLEDAR